MAHIDELQNRRKQLDARIAQVQAIKDDLQRRQETRAKIVLGGAVGVMARNDPELRSRIMAAIPNLVQDRDQAAILVLLETSSGRS
jgi:hypothetical protein